MMQLIGDDNMLLKAIMLTLLPLTVLAGCGGQYVLTVPDQVAPAGGDAAVVVRLQQNELAQMKRSIKSEPIRFRIGDGPLRSAFTDDLGFAAAAVPAPTKPGKVLLWAAMQNVEGDEVTAEASVWVWAGDRAVVAVDLDCLPGPSDADCSQARAAMGELSGKANLLYLTRISPYDQAAARGKLRACDYPDGPVIVWQRQYRHFARTGRLKLPSIVTEAHMASRLSYLREVFPSLTVGICDSARSAAAMAQAGTQPVVVGRVDLDKLTFTRRASWADLARRGITP